MPSGGAGRRGDLADRSSRGRSRSRPGACRAPPTVTRALPACACPELPVPVVTVAGDERDVGERLDVLDECRAAIDATLVWSRRDRGRPGIAALT